MIQPRFYLFVFLTILSGTLTTQAADALQKQASESGFSSERLAYIDKFFAERVDRGEMAGIVMLIARHGKVVHLSAVGYADIEKKEKMRTNTIFRIYSMTKPVTSVALMALYEDGLFQMDEPVSKYIPEFSHLQVLRSPHATLDDTVPPGRPPTIRDLMRHTAGLTHGGEGTAVDTAYEHLDLFGVDVSLEDLVGKLAQVPLAYQPGTRFVYSVGPDVQARLVEILSGTDFDDFLRTRLFLPLGMKDTQFWLPPEQMNRLATLYWQKDGKLTPLDTIHGYPKDIGVLAQPWSANSYAANQKRKGGSYGLLSTAEDYWRFAQMIANGGEFDGVRILSPEMVRYMTRDQMGSIPVDWGGLTGISWGLGFAIVKDPTATDYVSHEGTLFWGGLAATFFWIDPKEDMVVVAMSQHMGVPQLSSLQGQLHSLVYGALVE